MYYSHPPEGPFHPWHDPFARLPFGMERPSDVDMRLGPPVTDFPFNADGQRAYYDAVRRAAWDRRQREMHMRHQAEMAAAAEVQAAAVRARNATTAAFLLLQDR